MWSLLFNSVVLIVPHSLETTVSTVLFAFASSTNSPTADMNIKSSCTFGIGVSASKVELAIAGCLLFFPFAEMHVSHQDA